MGFSHVPHRFYFQHKKATKVGSQDAKGAGESQNLSRRKQNCHPERAKRVEEPILSLSKEPAVAFALAFAFLFVIPEGNLLLNNCPPLASKQAVQSQRP